MAHHARKKTIPLFKVFMSREVDKPLLKTLHSGYIGQGPKVEEFEGLLKKRFNNPCLITLSCATHGLHLAAILAGITSRDEVITTPLTCVSYRTRLQLEDEICEIGKVVNQKISKKVKCFNIKTEKIEYKNIINWIKLPSENITWYRLYLKDARSYLKGSRKGVWITGDHSVLTKRGYVRVDQLTKEDLVITDQQSLNNKQLEVVNGTLLGDSSISLQRFKACRFQFSHIVSQKEWFDLKLKAIKGFAFNIYKKEKYKQTKANWSIETQMGIQWVQLRNHWYSSRRKKIVPVDIQLTPLTLATWYLDDGCRDVDSAVFCTENFSYEAFWLLFWKVADLGLKPTAQKHENGFRLYIGNGHSTNKHNSANKFFNMIAPYVPQSMRYKLPNGFSEFDESLWELGTSVPLYSKAVILQKDPPKWHKPKYVYCVEVEDNHNFIISNMILQNCTATNWPFIYEKAKLVWADVKADDLNIDPESIKKRITNKTKAIVVMDWGGYPCDLEEIQKIGQENGIPIIEDASQSFGATYKDSVIGDCKFVDYTIISFQAIKQLTTVDGGMLSMRTEKDYKRGKLLRWYGMDRDTPRLDFRCEENVAEVGYKYHMNDVAATIGIEQLKYVDAKLEKTRENIEYYRKKLLGVPGVSLLQNAQDRQGSGWLFTILVENQTDFMRKMEERNVQVSRVHERNDKHTCMSEFKNTDLPVLNSVIKQMVAIPAGWWISEFERNYILWCIKDGW